MAAFVTARRLDDRRSGYLQKKRGRRIISHALILDGLFKQIRSARQFEKRHGGISHKFDEEERESRESASDWEIALVPASVLINEEGTYLRHDPRMERISERARAHGNCTSPAREFPNLLLKNSINRAVPGDNWTSTFFNPADPRAQMRLTRKSTRISGVRDGHLREMRFQCPVIRSSTDQSTGGRNEKKKKKKEKTMGRRVIDAESRRKRAHDATSCFCKSIGSKMKGK